MNTIRKAVLYIASMLALAGMPIEILHAQQKVTVTAAVPSEAPQGTASLDVEVSGSGFDSTAQVQFLVTGTTNPGGVTVKQVLVQGSKKLLATIDVAETAVVDKFDIEVKLSNGRKGKGTTLFTVQAKTANLDPCAAGSSNWQGFPAYAYFTNIPGGGNQDPYEVRLASANGRCSLRVLTVPENILNLSFAESSATPGLYRLLAGKYLFLRMAEFRVGTELSSGRPTLDNLTVVPDFRPSWSQFGFSGVDFAPDGERVAIIRYVGFDRRLTIADFDDATPDIDVCAWTGATGYPGDWTDVAWGPSGRISFLQHTYDQFLRVVGVDGNNPQPSPTQCDPEVIISFSEGPVGPAALGVPYLAHTQTVGVVHGVEYIALKVNFNEKVRKGAQGVCEIWVWNASTQPATRVLDSSNGAPRGGYPSFTSNGSLLYQPEPSTGCNPPYEIGELGFLGTATSIEGTATGRWPAGLKRRTEN